MLLLRLLPWKRGANEAVGTGWLRCCGICAPVPSALFAAPANLFTVDLTNINKLCPPESGLPNIAVSPEIIVGAKGSIVCAMRSFVRAKGRYVNAKRSFVRAKGSFVNTMRSFVRAKPNNESAKANINAANGSFKVAEPNITNDEANIELAKAKNTLSAGYLHKLLCRNG